MSRTLAAALLTRLGVCLSFLLFSRAQADTTDQCIKSVTAKGVFKTIASNGGHKQYKSTKDWFCSSDFLGAAQDHSIQASANTPWGGGSFSQNDSNQLQQRSQFCSNNSADFSSEDNSFLYQTEGDPVVGQMIQACLDHGGTANSYLVVATEPYADGTFDIKLSVRDYPNANVLFVDSITLGGAVPADVSDFARNASIPTIGSGSNPLTATYKFDSPTTPMARVKLKTNIGSIVARANRCPAGVVGHWKEYHAAPHTVTTPLGPWSDSKPIKQGYCHPHCSGGAGDQLHFDFYTASANIAFTNIAPPQLPNPGGDNLFQWDIVTVTQPEPNHLHVDVRSSTIATTLVLHADLIQTNLVSAQEKGDEGDITAGEPFTVKLRDTPDATLVLTSSQGGDTTLVAQNFAANTFSTSGQSSWVTPISIPQNSSGNWLATMKVVMPATCSLQ